MPLTSAAERLTGPSAVGWSLVPFKTIFEPFRIHSVEPFRLTTEEERRAAVQAVDFNLFRLRASDVPIDRSRTSASWLARPVKSPDVVDECPHVLHQHHQVQFVGG